MLNRIVYAAVVVLVGVMRRLPLRVCFALGAALGFVLWAVLSGYRRLVAANIRGAYGSELSPGQVRRLTRAHFCALGANGASALKIPALPHEAISRIAPIEGLENIRAALGEGRGVVLAINHIGNWELYAQLVSTVPEARFGTVYQSLRNPLVDALITRDRQRLGVLTFDRKKGFHGALALIREPGVLGVLVDQNAGDHGMWMPFFGRLASTSTLAAQLAQRTGAVVIPVAIHTAGFARWRVVVEKPLTQGSVAETTHAINRTLEEQIRRSPADWFWVHNRWKMPSPNFLSASQRRGTYMPPEGAPLRAFRMLARSPNWLGDAVMAAPAIRAFKRGRPDARLTVLTPEKLAPFWVSVEEVDEVLAIPRGQGVWGVAARLRGRFDAAILFPNSLRSALEAWLAGIPRRVGFAGNHRKAFLNQIIALKSKQRIPRPLHHADRYWALAARCGAGETPPPIRAWKAPDGFPVRITVCPGAEFGPAKRWPTENFRRVMDIISARVPCRWFVVGASGDAGVAAEVCTGFSGEVENLAGRTSLGELMDLLTGCHGLLTNDTGTMHLADALGVPLVAIFGSTEPALTGPRGGHSVVIRHQVECSPCFLRECPLDFRCMKSVQPESVADAFLDLLAASSPRIFPPPPLAGGT